MELPIMGSNVPTKHHTLTNKNPSVRIGLPLVEFLVSEVL